MIALAGNKADLANKRMVDYEVSMELFQVQVTVDRGNDRGIQMGSGIFIYPVK